MSTCKDCIHFELCDFDGTTAEFADGSAEKCRFFRNKSEFEHFPCMAVDKIWRAMLADRVKEENKNAEIH